MNIQSGYYEAGIALFWLLFAYLFMDKFLFKGQLGEICFGKARRRMAKALRGVAGWFDPVKEEQKKGRRRSKGKAEKKDVLVAPESEKRNVTTAKTEVKDKEKAEVKEQAEKLQLIHDKHELELRLKESEIKKCDVRGCSNRQPPSDY